jgi:hypothetical protein
MHLEKLKMYYNLIWKKSSLLVLDWIAFGLLGYTVSLQDMYSTRADEEYDPAVERDVVAC